MTEIKIEKKKPIWPWVLLAVIVVGILIYLFAGDDKEMETAVEDPAATEVVTQLDIDPVITRYFVVIDNDVDSMGLSHQFTNEALTNLIEATRFMAEKHNFDIKSDLDSAQSYAAVIKEEPFDTNHADKIRKAADILSNALVNLQQAKFSDLSSEANEVRSAAAAIEPATLTLEQKVAVKTFFREARDLLRAMSETNY